MTNEDIIAKMNEALGKAGGLDKSVKFDFGDDGKIFASGMICCRCRQHDTQSNPVYGDAVKFSPCFKIGRQGSAMWLNDICRIKI